MFAASVLVTGDLFEDRRPVWPGKPGKADAYPWRLPPSPSWCSTRPTGCRRGLVDELEHIGKWPREHWKLAFQGQLRTISDRDTDLLLERMRARSGVRA